jgi:tetratricopeptide (TPR) repeat protein
MFYLDPKFNTKLLQREMDKTFREAAMHVPDDSTFEDDLQALRALYKESGYAKARMKFESISSKWAGHMSPQEQVKLLKTIAKIAAVDTKFDQAQQFYLDALGVQSNNASLMLSKAECYMAEGDIAEARSWFRRAFFIRQDVHTAAKYGELLYLAGEKDELIKTMINPVLGQSISIPVPTRSELTIITLHLLTCTDPKFGAHTLLNGKVEPAVVDAVRKRKFHLWAVDHVDQGIALLADTTARRVYGAVEARLKGWAKDDKEAKGGEAKTN